MQQQQDPINGGVGGENHLGHMVFDFFNQPGDHVWQIDAATGEVATKSSVRSRSIQLARCLQNAGLKPGDVVAVSGVNHLDIHIPFYAGYLNGLPVSGIDCSYKFEEIKNLFRIIEPKLVFCEVSNVADYENVIKDLGLDMDTMVVTFGDGDKSFANFVKKYDDNAPDSEFRVATFDTHKVFAWLVTTSGTTGLPKVAAFSHTEIIKMVKIGSTLKQNEFVPVLQLASVQWITGYLSTLSMVSANHIRIHTSAPVTVEHIIDIINKYKPKMWISGPFILNKIMNHEKYCNMTCFSILIVTTCAMTPTFLEKLKGKMGPSGVVWNLLGQTESIGFLLLPAPDGPVGNCGRDLPLIPLELVDTNTGEVINEPNRPGELWTKGPRLTEYYKNPEATAAAFSADGWFKTGDLMYKDENGYFFFVERVTSSFRFRHGNLVTPTEMEHLIQQHADVVDVCVVGIPHPEDVVHAVACVQKKLGSTLTEQDVKDLVADKLSFHKHLHGGVIFVDDFPRTFSDKIARAKVRDFVIDLRSPTSEYPCFGNTKKLINNFQRLSSTSNVNVRLVGS